MKSLQGQFFVQAPHALVSDSEYNYGWRLEILYHFKLLQKIEDILLDIINPYKIFQYNIPYFFE